MSPTACIAVISTCDCLPELTVNKLALTHIITASSLTQFSVKIINQKINSNVTLIASCMILADNELLVLSLFIPDILPVVQSLHIHLLSTLCVLLI